MEREKSHGILKGIAITVGVLLAVLGVTGLLLYQSAQRAMAEVEKLQTQASSLGETFLSGDADAIRSSIGQIDSSAHAIHRETANPLWGLAEKLPVVGGDVHAARVLSDVLVDLNDNILVPLGDRAEYLTLDGYLTSEGFSLDGINSLVELLEDAQPVVERSHAAIEALPQPTISKLNEVVTTTRDMLDTVENVLIIVNSLIDAVQEFFA